MKQIVYIDMDGPMVDFESGIARLDPSVVEEFAGRLDEVPGIFGLMDPTPGAVDAFHRIADRYDTYLLSTAPWENPSAWADKLAFVHRSLGRVAGTPAYKRLIISHNKHLNRGDYLVDDRPNNGASEFEGEWIHYGSKAFPNWDAVLERLGV